MIPIVVGALGAVAKLEEYLGMIEIQQKEVDRIQFSALLGTATILRKVLDVSGWGSNRTPIHTGCRAEEININNNNNNDNNNNSNNNKNKNHSNNNDKHLDTNF